MSTQTQANSEIDSLLSEDQTITAQPQKNRGLSLGSIVLIIGIMVAVATIGYALAQQNRTLNPGQSAPNFTFETFDGETFNLAEHRGKIIVVNFWASWCGPCHQEAETLQTIHEEYADRGVILIGITYNDSSRQASLDFIDTYGITYLNGPDVRGGKIAKDYVVTGVPETFVIDQEGNLVEVARDQVKYNGAVDQKLIQLLDELLAEDQAVAQGQP